MKIILLTLAGLWSFPSAVVAATLSEAGPSSSSSDYLSVRVDRVVIDTSGLASASTTLAGSVDSLALAISQLSVENTNLTNEQIQTLMQAVQSVDAASVALTTLSRQLPASAKGLSEQLPTMINAAREPLAELSRGLESARDSIYIITESLPTATDNVRQLVNATLDSAVLRLSIYTFVLLAAIGLAIIGIVWFIYWQYLAPLARKLDALVGAPEHFDNMSRHMKETAKNLLALQQRERRAVVCGADRFRRR